MLKLSLLCNKNMPSTIVYTTTLINEKLTKTTTTYASTYVKQILKEFETFLGTSNAVGKSEWTREFECSPSFMEPINAELKKHFESSVFVRVYGGVASNTSNKLICQISWGAD